MHRRALLSGAAALALATPACAAPKGAIDDLPPLKSVAPYPLGVAVKTPQLPDPDWTGLAAAQFSRLTAEWEMKMEYVLRDDGS
ncbi:MAG: 1,4-beta-xylanase, partial [Asticcacaulis sp.]|nr:1,4-beta-xylanase [Asticcacaulis sp.]